jgi:hypothetical protein
VSGERKRAKRRRSFLLGNHPTLYDYPRGKPHDGFYLIESLQSARKTHIDTFGPLCLDSIPTRCRSSSETPPLYGTV